MNDYFFDSKVSDSDIFNGFFKYLPLLSWIYLVREFDIGTAPFRGQTTMAGRGHWKKILNILKKSLRPHLKKKWSNYYSKKSDRQSNFVEQIKYEHDDLFRRYAATHRWITHYQNEMANKRIAHEKKM